MEERTHTNKELHKLEMCRTYLMDQGIFDVDSFNELVV